MKKTKVLKIFGLASIAALAMTFHSCSKKTSSETLIGTAEEPGWKKNADTPITFDWYINFSWFARHWD